MPSREDASTGSSGSAYGHPSRRELADLSQIARTNRAELGGDRPALPD